MTGEQTLAQLRAGIDECDSQLVQLLAKRNALTSQIGAIKQEIGAPLHAPDRESLLIEARRQQAEQHNIKTLLVTVHPVIEEALYKRHSKTLDKFYLSRGGANKIIDSYNSVIREVAKKNDVALIDFAEVAKEIIRTVGCNRLVKKDGVHLAPVGKKLLGKVVAEALKQNAAGAENIVCLGDSITHFGYMTETLMILDPERFPVYSTSIASNQRHPDTDPPSLLFDGKYSNISSDSVDYAGDVKINVDMRKMKKVGSIELFYFNDGNYKLKNVKLLTGSASDKLEPSGAVEIKGPYDRKVKSIKFNVNRKIKYFVCFLDEFN